MSPIRMLQRSFNASVPAEEFAQQWTHPSDIFSILLLLGGDVVACAAAQIAGGWITPIAFSFGWVSYAVTAVRAAAGDNKLMPVADCACTVINGRNGYVKENTSWVIGRIMRDHDYWMHPDVKQMAQRVVDEKFEELGKMGETERPKQAGLCVSIYRADHPVKVPVHDWVYYSGFFTIIIQLAVAAIPCGLYGDWGILMITAAGILLSLLTGSLPQWREEKWACRKLKGIKPGKEKRIILTRGNGSQHAIVIIGGNGCLHLEDLALGSTNMDFSASWSTSISLFLLAILWIVLLVTASGIETNPWYLLGVGSIGMIQNIIVVGAKRNPEAFGVPVKFEHVIGKTKVMETLYAVDEQYKGLGRAMLDTFFPGGKLRQNEKERWEELDNRKE